MSETPVLTDTNWEEKLQDKAAIVLFSDGSGLRSDFDSLYKRASKENKGITFVQINPADAPEFAARFEADGSRPVMIALYKGGTLARRPKPWGSDLTLAIEMLQDALKKALPEPVNTLNQKEQPMSDQPALDTAPVNVTDQTFQTEVVDYDLPVLVDFWAEWCGPCRMVAPILEKLAAEYAGKIRVAKVNVDENPGLSQTFRVMSIPTIMVFKERHLIFSQPGAFPEAAFRELIDQAIALEIDHSGHDHDHDHDHEDDSDDEAE